MPVKVEARDTESVSVLLALERRTNPQGDE
jgi:hypothetical protein